MSTLQLFTWGYWGWGTAAQRLIEAVDSVESSRGFAPPVFADIRLRRQGRAPNFVGDRFERQLGADRYCWFPGLGNRAIAEGGAMTIDHPADVALLLNLAESADKSGRRVLFFCACAIPGTPGDIRCHRCEVASLALAEGRQRKVEVETTEWPGGEPERRTFELSTAAFMKVKRGAKSIPLPDTPDLAVWAAVPWYSVVTVREKNGSGAFAVRSGPAQFQASRGGWHLPVFGETVDLGDQDELFSESVELFSEDGFAIRTTR